MMIIYTIIFGIVFQTSEQYFPIFIFFGIALWSFFSRGVICSVNIIRANRDIITKLYIPKFVLYYSRLLVYAFKTIVSLGVALIMMIFFKVPLTLKIVYCLPILIIVFVFTFGVGTILMNFGVYVSDLGYVTDILLNMLMYASGIFYSIRNTIPMPFGIILEDYNPIACLIAAMRNAALYAITPDFSLLKIWFCISVLLIFIGVSIIYKNENAYVKVI